MILHGSGDGLGRCFRCFGRARTKMLRKVVLSGTCPPWFGGWLRGCVQWGRVGMLALGTLAASEWRRGEKGLILAVEEFRTRRKGQWSSVPAGSGALIVPHNYVSDMGTECILRCFPPLQLAWKSGMASGFQGEPDVALAAQGWDHSDNHISAHRTTFSTTKGDPRS